MRKLKFKIKEKEYEVPDYLSIEQYSKLYRVKDLFDEEYYQSKLINIVTGAEVKDLLETDFEEVLYITGQIISLLPTKKDIEFVDRFELDGVHYGFFPKWQELTFAEFIDMDTISTKKSDEVLSMLHILAAIMYRPIVEEKTYHDFKIEKYDVKLMEERAELFKKKLDVRYVLGAQTFFTRLGYKYSIYSQLSLIPKLTLMMKIKLVWKMRRLITEMIFKRSLGGTWSSTELLETILRSTTTSIKKR